MAFNFGVDVLPTSTETLSLGSSSLKWLIYGELYGNSATATQLASPKEIYVNLGSARDTSSKITFDGTADKAIAVNGVLNVANGGTGVNEFSPNSVIMSGASKTAALTTRAVANLSGPNNLSSQTGTDLATVNTVLNARAIINGAAQKSDVYIYAPTSAYPATASSNLDAVYFLKAQGSGQTPDWQELIPSVTVTSGTTSQAPYINISVGGQSSSTVAASYLSVASDGNNGIYGVTKLSSVQSTTATNVAATPKGVWDAIANATIWIGTQEVHATITNSTISGLSNSFNVNQLVTDLGLNRAFQYRGVTTTYPLPTTGYNAGDVLIVESTSGGANDGVYTFDGTNWAKLSANTSAYKFLQDPVSDVSLTNDRTTGFICSITQDQNGVISPIKKSYAYATTQTAGVISIGDGLSVTDGVASVNYGTSGNVGTALGANSLAGSSTQVARADHSHPMPTAGDIGASGTPITANMGTMDNSEGSTTDTITIAKTVLGVTADMTVDRIMVGTPTAFLSDITVTTAANTVTISADLAAGASSTISVKLSNNRDVTGV